MKTTTLKKRRFSLCFVFYAIFALFSCVNETQPIVSFGNNVRVRISLISTGAGAIRGNVDVEGPGGNALSGKVDRIRDQ
jgi:hypothetical protein